jgi:hypothetical protein
MKKWRQILQSFLSRHIVAPEPVATITIIKEFNPGPQLPQFAAGQPEAHKQQKPLFVDYSAGHPTIINELRHDGWIVELQVDADGNLGYALSVDRSGTLS